MRETFHQEHVKHFTPILRVCPECRDIRWLPNQYEKARQWGGYIQEPLTWEEDGKKYHHKGFSKLELADLMQELANIRTCLSLIKRAFNETRSEIVKGWTSPPLNWEKFIKSYFENI